MQLHIHGLDIKHRHPATTQRRQRVKSLSVKVMLDLLSRMRKKNTLKACLQSDFSALLQKSNTAQHRTVQLRGQSCDYGSVLAAQVDSCRVMHSRKKACTKLLCRNTLKIRNKKKCAPPKKTVKKPCNNVSEKKAQKKQEKKKKHEKKTTATQQHFTGLSLSSGEMDFIFCISSRLLTGGAVMLFTVILKAAKRHEGMKSIVT